MSSGANTKYVQLAVPVPRDPEQYRTTTHFGQRLRDRVPEDIQGRVVAECITEGRCHGTTPRDAEADRDDIVQTFGFDHHLEGRHWRVVVGLRERAFLSRGREHLALTVYEVDG